MIIIDYLELILDFIFKLAIVIAILIGVRSIVNLLKVRLIDIKNKEIENEKVKVYSTIDPQKAKEELISLIREYTSRYVTKNIMVNNIDFVKNDQIDEMVKSIVKDTVLEMSDMYLTYCKLLYNIQNEDDLLKVIYYLTVDIVLDTVTKINQTIS